MRIGYASLVLSTIIMSSASSMKLFLYGVPKFYENGWFKAIFHSGEVVEHPYSIVHVLDK
jgi:hypothetical protein